MIEIIAETILTLLILLTLFIWIVIFWKAMFRKKRKPRKYWRPFK